MSGASPLPLPRRKISQAGPCADGWTYYVTAHGIGREWLVESYRSRLDDKGRAVKQRLFSHSADAPFDAGRWFERDLSLFRDIVADKRAKK